jgi:3-phosphoshikimate 1-carboxyvinyltransferase
MSSTDTGRWETSTDRREAGAEYRGERVSAACRIAASAVQGGHEPKLKLCIVISLPLSFRTAAGLQATVVHQLYCRSIIKSIDISKRGFFVVYFLHKYRNFCIEILISGKKYRKVPNMKSSKVLTPASVTGDVLIPASKSQTIRALLIASAAGGTSVLRNPLDSHDTRSCASFCRAIGARIEEDGSSWRVTGGKNPDLIDTGTPLILDIGNSGTTICLGAGFAASLGIPVILTGDRQIRSRPVANLFSAYSDLGVRVSYAVPGEYGLEPAQAPGCPPVLLQGPVRGGSVRIACPTSQYLSSLLLAAVTAENQVDIEVTLLNEAPYVEMTLEWLDEQKIVYSRSGLQRFSFPGGGSFTPFDKIVPGDYSSASFFFCMAAVTGGSLTLHGLSRRDSQGDRMVLTWLERMGCSAVWEDEQVTVTGPPPGTLKGIDIDLNSAPDALPVLAVTGCFARGTTRLLNVPQARIKETDRIAVMAAELGKLNADIRELEDGLEIRGKALTGGNVCGHGDHRVIMALATASLAADGPVTIDDISASDVTFPAFFDLLESIRA